MKYKKWSLEEKLEILSFSKENGIVSTFHFLVVFLLNVLCFVTKKYS
jgi:hypothetical protein